jgi:hypothetical protein
MSGTNEPSAAAFRAADALVSINQGIRGSAPTEVIAHIIDRETGLPGLLHQLERVVEATNKGLRIERKSQVDMHIRAAIAWTKRGEGVVGETLYAPHQVQIAILREQRDALLTACEAFLRAMAQQACGLNVDATALIEAAVLTEAAITRAKGEKE